jgi:type II secretory pathway pseudopilin PulG
MRAMALLARVRQRLRRARSEDGFGVVELVIAISILAVLMLSLAYVGTASLADVAYARQRDQASALANQALEEVRALPFATVAAGLSTSDVESGSDPRITPCDNGAYCFGGEEIPTGDNPDVVPLVPHQQTVVEGPTTFQVSVYVTHYDNELSSPIYRVTAIVTWDRPARGGLAPEVEAQTIVSSPAGCESTATHPFAAPCTPFFYASASELGGSVTVGGEGGNPPIPGLPVSEASLSLTTSHATAQLEQVDSLEAGATTSGATIDYGDGTPSSTTGAVSASASASDDASQSVPPYESTSANQSASTIEASQSGESLALVPGSADTAAATAATSAGSPPSSTCQDETGQDLTTGEPCAEAPVETAGSEASAVMTLVAGSSSLGPATLASVGPAPSPTTAGTAFYQAAGSDACTLASSSGPGCIHAGVVESLGTVELAGLPSGLPAGDVPPGWAGYLVALSGYSAQVAAEAGSGAGAPVSTVTGGTIAYWDGNGYATMPVPTASGTAVPVASVRIDDPTTYGAPLVVTIDASLTAGGTSTDDPASGCTSPCTRTTASAEAGPPLQGTITYTVTYGSATLAAVTLGVNLGTASASASYQAAPSGS